LSLASFSCFHFNVFPRYPEFRQSRTSARKSVRRRRCPTAKTRQCSPSLGHVYSHHYPYDSTCGCVIPIVHLFTNARIISILMTLDTLAQYYSTASLYQGSKYLWPAPSNTNFAPTLLTLAEALITLVLCSIVLISYSHGVNAADQWDGRREFFDKCVSGLTFILSASAAGAMFQTGNDTESSTKSLWEFACNATSQQQSFWYQFFDYGTFCLMQVGSLCSM
jgi:hypothetical protein